MKQRFDTILIRFSNIILLSDNQNFRNRPNKNYFHKNRRILVNFLLFTNFDTILIRLNIILFSNQNFKNRFNRNYFHKNRNIFQLSSLHKFRYDSNIQILFYSLIIKILKIDPTEIIFIKIEEYFSTFFSSLIRFSNIILLSDNQNSRNRFNRN